MELLWMNYITQSLINPPEWIGVKGLTVLHCPSVHLITGMSLFIRWFLTFFLLIYVILSVWKMLEMNVCALQHIHKTFSCYLFPKFVLKWRKGLLGTLYLRLQIWCVSWGASLFKCLKSRLKELEEGGDALAKYLPLNLIQDMLNYFPAML